VSGEGICARDIEGDIFGGRGERRQGGAMCVAAEACLEGRGGEAEMECVFEQESFDTWVGEFGAWKVPLW
tara:strand:- start:22377 stop:22586 length:210 start_codon:yes stop_codon:yes gene_type:complete